MNQLKIILVTFVVLLGAYGFIQSQDKPEFSNDKIGLDVGDQAPELEFWNPDSSKTYKLSELRGKIVLIDFWASWCRPCRMENPNLVEAYNKYKKAKFTNAKGFEIFSVSLDKSRSSWTNAIKQDGLDWQYHVSDLKGWGAKGAKLFQVRSIPSSFLINEDGIIVAKNLRGQKLHLELDKSVRKL